MLAFFSKLFHNNEGVTAFEYGLIAVVISITAITIMSMVDAIRIELPSRTNDPDQLKAVLGPYPADDMKMWPVSARVGNVKNNDPTLVQPIMLPEASA